MKGRIWKLRRLTIPLAKADRAGPVMAKKVATALVAGVVVAVAEADADEVKAVVVAGWEIIPSTPTTQCRIVRSPMFPK